MFVRAAVWVGRLGEALTILFLGLFLGYASTKGGSPSLAQFGGLKHCMYCANGWNWHALMFSVVFGIAMPESFYVLYRPDLGHESRKRSHWGVQASAIVLSVVGLTGIVRNRQYMKQPMMFSLHSWRGAICMDLFAMQFVIGLFSFVLLKTRLKDETRAAIMKFHRIFGKITYFAGIGTAMNGWAEYQAVMQKMGQPAYNSASLVPVGVGLALWLVCAAVAYLFMWNDGQTAPIAWRERVKEASKVNTKESAMIDLHKSEAGGAVSEDLISSSRNILVLCSDPEVQPAGRENDFALQRSNSKSREIQTL